MVKWHSGSSLEVSSGQVVKWHGGSSLEVSSHSSGMVGCEYDNTYSL